MHSFLKNGRPTLYLIFQVLISICLSFFSFSLSYLLTYNFLWWSYSAYTIYGANKEAFDFILAYFWISYVEHEVVIKEIRLLHIEYINFIGKYFRRNSLKCRWAVILSVIFLMSTDILYCLKICNFNFYASLLVTWRTPFPYQR